MGCPLCQNPECQTRQASVQNTVTFGCNNCGNFSFTGQALAGIGADAWKLSAYVFEQNQRGIRPTFYASSQSVPSGESAGHISLETAIDSFPRALPDRLDRALLNMAAVSHCLGQAIHVSNLGVNPMLLTQNTTETFFVIRQFSSEGFVNGYSNSLPTSVALTAKGLNRAADLQRGLFGPLNKQVFVAMSFDKSLDAAWGDGLKLGIEDCGYSAMRVDRKQHNEKICDVIIAEIRKSKFLVADFTLHRNGVYFEAGMMMGLGRPVIFTCRKDDLAKAHFDTRQYNHIEWETPAELRDKLKSRIQATITP